MMNSIQQEKKKEKKKKKKKKDGTVFFCENELVLKVV